jgi:hypothetical protein
MDDMMQEISFDNDRPVTFSDSVFSTENNAETCVLCTSSNNDERGHSIIEELKKIDDRLIGKVSDRAIFCLMAQWYDEKVKQPQLRYDNNAKVLEITPEICKKHFTHHDLNPKRIVKDDIQFINSAQTFLRENGVLKQNMSSGAYSINSNYIKQWNILSKTKLDLLRYYKNEFNNDMIENGNSSGPHQFSSF